MKPTQAAEGFARGLGVGIDELTVRDDYVWGRPSAPPLGERLWQVVGGLAAGKTMTWDRELDIRFPRPIRWICAKLDAETIEVGPEAIPSGSVSYGHRFVAGTVEIPHASAYETVLRKAQVEPDSAERRRLIVEGLDATGEWNDPARVLEEVVYLVESPLVLEGSFDKRFLDLPERVIVTAMQSHQRYFPLGGARFAFVANGGDPDIVRLGNERVLEGRLDDARFSYERDVQVGIEAMAEQLDSITFHARAGTFADKAVRLRELCDLLGGGEASGEAARLAKADQASTMVHEFPELEGFIGGEYARLAGVPEGVAAAIAEHYLPDQAGGPLPETAAGRVLSAADKIDNLTVAFALGEPPRGSRDPYGLRRAAIGLSRLAVDGELEIDLAGLVTRDLELLTEQGAEVTDDASDVPEFVLERLEGLLDVPVEFVRAARRSALTELGAVARLAQALAAEAGSQAFADVYTAFDRANSLAGKAGRGRAGDRSQPGLRACRAGTPRDPGGSRAAHRRCCAGAGVRRGTRSGVRARPARRPVLRRGARHDQGRDCPGEPPAPSPGRQGRGRRARRSLADPSLDGWSVIPCPRDGPGQARVCHRPLARPGGLTRARVRPGAVSGLPSEGVVIADRPSTRVRGVTDTVELHVISDATGETATRVVQAVERQFPDLTIEVVRHPRITSADDVHLAAARARGRRAVVVYTLVETGYRELMRMLCRRYKLHYCDLLGHPIEAVAKVSGLPAKMEAGAPPKLDSSYFKRMAAIEFAVRFDDGAGAHGLKDADIVLVGVSRSSKTPALHLPRIPGLQGGQRPDRQGNRPAAGALGRGAGSSGRSHDRSGDPGRDPGRACPPHARPKGEVRRARRCLRRARVRGGDPQAARLSHHRGLEPCDRGDGASNHQDRAGARHGSPSMSRGQIPPPAGPKGPVPWFYWPFWGVLLALGLFVFYVILTPVWMGIRLVAWLSERGRSPAPPA